MTVLSHYASSARNALRLNPSSPPVDRSIGRQLLENLKSHAFLWHLVGRAFLPARDLSRSRFHGRTSSRLVQPSPVYGQPLFPGSPFSSAKDGQQPNSRFRTPPVGSFFQPTNAHCGWVRFSHRWRGKNSPKPTPKNMNFSLSRPLLLIGGKNCPHLRPVFTQFFPFTAPHKTALFRASRTGPGCVFSVRRDKPA